MFSSRSKLKVCILSHDHSHPTLIRYSDFLVARAKRLGIQVFTIESERLGFIMTNFVKFDFQDLKSITFKRLRYIKYHQSLRSLIQSRYINAVDDISPLLCTQYKVPILCFEDFISCIELDLSLMAKCYSLENSFTKFPVATAVYAQEILRIVRDVVTLRESVPEIRIMFRGQYGLGIFLKKMFPDNVGFFDICQQHERMPISNVKFYVSSGSLSYAQFQRSITWPKQLNNVVKNKSASISHLEQELLSIESKVRKTHHSVYSPKVNGKAACFLQSRGIKNRPFNVVYLSSFDEDNAAINASRVLKEHSSDPNFYLDEACTQESFLKSLLQYSGAQDLPLLIRVHPRMATDVRVNTSASLDGSLQNLFSRLDEKDNTFVIPPDADVSSYELAARSNNCFAYHSSISLDLLRLGINCKLIAPRLYYACPQPTWLASELGDGKPLKVEDLYSERRNRITSTKSMNEILNWCRLFYGRAGPNLFDLTTMLMEVKSIKDLDFYGNLVEKLNFDSSAWLKVVLLSFYHPLMSGGHPRKFTGYNPNKYLVVKIESNGCFSVIDRLNAVSYFLTQNSVENFSSKNSFLSKTSINKNTMVDVNSVFPKRLGDILGMITAGDVA